MSFQATLSQVSVLSQMQKSISATGRKRRRKYLIYCLSRYAQITALISAIIRRLLRLKGRIDARSKNAICQMSEQLTSANFSFLAVQDAQLVRLGALAERYFKDDPNTSLLKLRQYGETLAQLVAAKVGLFRDAQEPQSDLLRRLSFDRVIPREVGDLFHHLRIVGNRATHENEGNHTQALTALKVGRELGIWFQRTFGAGKSFVSGAFVPPPDPSDATKARRCPRSRYRFA